MLYTLHTDSYPPPITLDTQTDSQNVEKQGTAVTQALSHMLLTRQSRRLHTDVHCLEREILFLNGGRWGVGDGTRGALHLTSPNPTQPHPHLLMFTSRTRYWIPPVFVSQCPEEPADLRVLAQRGFCPDQQGGWLINTNKRTDYKPGVGGSSYFLYVMIGIT